MLDEWKRLEGLLRDNKWTQYVKPPAHLKPATILLNEIIIHSTDHPLVFIQDLCLEMKKKRKIKVP